MITAARLPDPTLKMEASLLTKFFSCSYCGASILREESITNTISNSWSHFGSGWLGVVLTEEDAVEDWVDGIGEVVPVVVSLGVVLAVVVSIGVVRMGPGGSFKQLYKTISPKILSYLNKHSYSLPLRDGLLKGKDVSSSLGDDSLRP